MVNFRADAEAIHFWWHSIDLGGGVITRGAKSPTSLQAELDALRLPDLAGRSVLDIGAWDGYFSFAAERRGAARVVALDHDAWRTDTDSWGLARARRDRARLSPWHPRGLIGKRGFDLARHALGSGVEDVLGDFSTMDIAALGSFDVVLLLGVLYHLDDPAEGLRRLRRLTRELAIIETPSSACLDADEGAVRHVVSGADIPLRRSGWWSPDAEVLERLCREAGFARTVTLTSPPAGARPDARGTVRYRHVLHALP